VSTQLHDFCIVECSDARSTTGKISITMQNRRVYHRAVIHNRLSIGSVVHRACLAVTLIIST